MGVEFEGPKPFCALEKTGKPIIDSFVDLGFGKPVLRIETSPDGKMFIGAGVIRDAPCGSTWFVAKKLGWTDTPDIKKLFQAPITPPLAGCPTITTSN
jgi:thymidylate synthase